MNGNYYTTQYIGATGTYPISEEIALTSNNLIDYTNTSSNNLIDFTNTSSNNLIEYVNTSSNSIINHTHTLVNKGNDIYFSNSFHQYYYDGVYFNSNAKTFIDNEGNLKVFHNSGNTLFDDSLFPYPTGYWNVKDKIMELSLSRDGMVVINTELQGALRALGWTTGQLTGELLAFETAMIEAGLVGFAGLVGQFDTIDKNIKLTSNNIRLTSNNLIIYTNNTSNNLIEYTNTTSNNLIEYTNTTSNNLIEYTNTTSNDLINYANTKSNNLTTDVNTKIDSLWIKNGINVYNLNDNIGIGLANPNALYKLDVNGNINVSGTSTLQGKSTIGTTQNANDNTTLMSLFNDINWTKDFIFSLGVLYERISNTNITYTSSSIVPVDGKYYGFVYNSPSNSSGGLKLVDNSPTYYTDTSVCFSFRRADLLTGTRTIIVLQGYKDNYNKLFRLDFIHSDAFGQMAVIRYRNTTTNTWNDVLVYYIPTGDKLEYLHYWSVVLQSNYCALYKDGIQVQQSSFTAVNTWGITWLYVEEVRDTGEDIITQRYYYADVSVFKMALTANQIDKLYKFKRSIDTSSLKVNGSANIDTIYLQDIFLKGEKLPTIPTNTTQITEGTNLYFTSGRHDYTTLINKPTNYQSDWNTTIINKPTNFQSDWNSTIINKPTNFQSDWNSTVINKPTIPSSTTQITEGTNLYFTSGRHDYNTLINKPTNFQSDWNTTIINKPTNFQSDWNSTVINKPTNFQSDWNTTIINKPTIPASQINSDWNITDTNSKAFIMNKPTIPSASQWTTNTGYINYNNIQVYPSEIRVSYPDGLLTINSYLRYRFQSGSLTTDSSGNNRTLTTTGTYQLLDSKNTLLLSANDATIPSANWSTFNDLTISGWFKTSSFANGDKLLEFDNSTIYTTTKYPRQALTSDTFTYTDGTVVKTIGSTRFDTSFHSWFNAFNYKTTSDNGWADTAGYNSSTGYSSRTEYRTGYAGEWIMIDLGESMILENYRIYPRASDTNRVPRNLRLYGSTDVNCWNNINHTSLVLIEERTDIPNYTASTYGEFIITGNSTPYRFYAFICNRNYGDAYINPHEIELYGKKQSIIKNIKVINNNNQLSFQINNTPVYETAYTLNSTWSHILWNITSSTLSTGFVRINNGTKQTFTEVSLVSSTYTNKLGSTTNVGSINVADFRILTIPITPTIENELYSPTPTYTTLVDDAYVSSAIANLNVSSDWNSITNKPSSLTYLDATSSIQTQLNAKQATLTAGTNITIVGNTISSTGGGSDTRWTTSGTSLYLTTTTNNFGIGLTNPNASYKLDVAGNINSSGTISGTHSGDGSAITNINAGNIASGTLAVARGGTGKTTITANTLLGAGATANVIQEITAGTGITISGGVISASGGTDTRWTSGTGLIYLTSTTDKVGIGNSAPLGMLSVGNSAVDTSDGNIVIGKKSGGSTRQFKIGYNSAFDTVIGDFGMNNTASTWQEQIKMAWNAPANSLVISSTGVISGNGSGLTTLNAGNISSGTLGVANGGTGKTTITANTLLGAGTTANVIQEITAGTNITISGGVISSTGGTDTRWTTINTNDVYLTSLGNVGIGGNFTPINDLHLHNATNPSNVGLRITDGGTGATATDGSSIVKDTSHALGIWNFENANMFFGTNNAERVRILANGNVGIGTNNPPTPLAVNGTLSFDTLYNAPSTGLYGANNGTKIVLYQGGTGVYPYALGIESSTMWYSVPTGALHKFYIGGTNLLTLNSTTLTLTGNLSVSGSTTLRPANDIWHTSPDGKYRLYFLTNSTTYFGSQNGYVWRNSTDNVDLMTLTNAGNVSATGNISTNGSFLFTNTTSATSITWSDGGDLGKARITGQYSTDATVGDIILRANTGDLLILQSGSGSYGLLIDSTNNVFAKNQIIAYSSITTIGGNLVAEANGGAGGGIVCALIQTGSFRMTTGGTQLWVMATNLRSGTSEYDIWFSYQNSVKSIIPYNGNGGYTNFTGSHHTYTDDKKLYNDDYIGRIVSSSGKYKNIDSKYGKNNMKRNIDINDALPIVYLSSNMCDKSVFGVISSYEDTSSNQRMYDIQIRTFADIDGGDHRLKINACGEGAILVSDCNGNLENGDYICSSPVLGIGMKQDDDILRNYTVAKITCDCDFNPQLVPIEIIKQDEYFVINSSNLTSNMEYTITNNITSNIEWYDYETSNMMSSNIDITTSHMMTSNIEYTIYTSNYATSNLLDEEGNPVYEYKLDETSNIIYEYEYDLKYAKLDGTFVDFDYYSLNTSNTYKVALVGCTYKCS